MQKISTAYRLLPQNFTHSSAKRYVRIALLSLTSVALAACVTTHKGGFAEKADQTKAYETSLQLAKSYISQGNWEQAKRHLQYVEAADRRNAETLEALALVYQNTGELEMAEQYYRRAVDQAPKSMRIRNNFAVFLYQLKRYREAAEHLELVTAEVLYERRVDAFINLGRCYLQLDELDRAEAAFRRALLMQSDSPQVLLSLGEVAFRQAQYAESQRFYDAFRDVAKRQSAASLWLGIRLADIFDDGDAYASYALALKNLYPKSEEYLFYKASASGAGR